MTASTIPLKIHSPTNAHSPEVTIVISLLCIISPYVFCGAMYVLGLHIGS